MTTLHLLRAIVKVNDGGEAATAARLGLVTGQSEESGRVAIKVAERDGLVIKIASPNWRGAAAFKLTAAGLALLQQSASK